MFVSFIKYLRTKNINKPNKTKHAGKLIKHLCPNDFEDEYINKIINCKRNKIYILLNCSNYDRIYLTDVIGFIVIRNIGITNKIQRYAIPMLGIHNKVRSCGYGKMLLDQIILFLKKNKIIELVLHSLEKSKLFYINYGFIKIEKNKYLERIEELENDSILLKYII